MHGPHLGSQELRGGEEEPGEPLQSSGCSGAFLLAQREKGLLESVGLLASERSGDSLSTKSHWASIIVKTYLGE